MDEDPGEIVAWVHIYIGWSLVCSERVLFQGLAVFHFGDFEQGSFRVRHFVFRVQDVCFKA